MTPAEGLETNELELAPQRKGRGAGATHPIPSAKPTAHPPLQGGMLLFFTGTPLFPPCTPGENDLQGDSKPLGFPGVAGMDGGVCCEIL